MLAARHDDDDTVLLIYKYTWTIFYKKLIFFKIKDIRIVLFLAEINIQQIFFMLV